MKPSSARRSFRSLLLLPLLLAACNPAETAAVIIPTVGGIPSLTAPANTPVPLAARVNGEGIPLAEGEAGLAQLQDAQTRLGAALPDEEQRQRNLDRLIDETLLAQGAQQAGFALGLTEAQDRLDDLAARMGGTEALASWQQRMGYTSETFLQIFPRLLAAAWQRDRLAATVPDRLEQVRARQLLFLDRGAADEALSTLKNGSTTFDDLAYALDPATRGDLGWFPRGCLTQPAVEEAAFALQPGQFSEVIPSALGYHIVYVAAREADRPLTMDARLALQRKAVSDWLAARRAEGRIEIVSPPAAVQTPAAETGQATYTVLSGDSYYSIARQFGVTVPELLAANPGLDQAGLGEGSSLNVPGRPGIRGDLAVLTVPAGENLTSLARLHQIPFEDLALLNRLTSPAELYAGSDLVLPAAQAAPSAKRLPGLESGEPLLVYAALLGENPWLLLEANQAGSGLPLLPGEPLYLPGAGQAGSPLPSAILSFTLDPLPLVQGHTTVVTVTTDGTTAPSGRLDGRDLAFFETGENTYAAIQGIHVMSEPGLIAFSLQAQSEDDLSLPFEEMLLLASGEYAYDPPLTVDPQTIDPAVTQPEADLIASLTAAATPVKYWDGPFGFPIDRQGCSPSPFGSRRSYNGGPYTFFHGGLDYGLCANPNIYAPAPGVVVFTGLLTVRGSATIIDHGWGVYSGIWHQSEIYVEVGDMVQMGQFIGKIGDTGRVTGAHLHWEIWSNGVQVNPIDWLARSFP